jgi:hypothetical protein
VWLVDERHEEHVQDADQNWRYEGHGEVCSRCGPAPELAGMPHGNGISPGVNR